MITKFNQLDLTKKYSYADYLTWSFENRVELYKGKIFKFDTFTNIFHQKVATNLTGIMYQFIPSKNVLIAGKLFIWGIIVFSGSLYLMTILSITHVRKFNWIGAITPLGGILLIAGWLLLALTVYRNKD